MSGNFTFNKYWTLRRVIRHLDAIILIFVPHLMQGHPIKLYRDCSFTDILENYVFHKNLHILPFYRENIEGFVLKCQYCSTLNRDPAKGYQYPSLGLSW